MAKILVIDDERSIRNTMKDILEFEKHKVVLAENGRVGLDTAINDEFDLIFSDIKMPEMDGIAFLEAVMKERGDVSVIMISGHAEIDIAVKSIKIGANDYLSVDKGQAISDGMAIELWREGKQTVTVEEEVDFEIEKVQDANREVGYREVKTPGVKGKRNATYEIEMKNGQEASRTEIASVTIEEPKKQVEIIGAKLPTPTNPTEAQAIGKEMMLAAGFGEDQWGCLYNLWMRESGWRTTAGNVSSGAYGIPQSLPASNMAAFGGDYLTNPRTQIAWGLSYIKGRYGTPCGGWSAFQAKGWY